MAKIALAVGIGALGALTGGLGWFGFVASASHALLGFSLGMAAGSLLGNVLMPTHIPNQVGPRLSDLTVSSAVNGMPIPIGYGTYRLAGCIIWSGGLIENSKTSKQSSKGGPSYKSTTYTYTTSFAVSFGESYGSTPATRYGNILKVWFDAKIAYDVTNGTNTSQYPAPTIYNGTETQNPDPTIQGIQGVNATPAFRGLVYGVWNSFPLADFGNRLPNIQALVQYGNPQPALSDMIIDICTRAGIPAANIDISQIVTAQGTTGTQSPLGRGGLCGAFTDASGNVIQPISIGYSATVAVPAGATQLQLGIDDDDINQGDNTGSFNVTVTLTGGNTWTGTVDGRSAPWDFGGGKNANYDIGNNAATQQSSFIAPKVVGLTLQAGQTLTITYNSGTVTYATGGGSFDALGDQTFVTADRTDGSTHGYFPTHYMHSTTITGTTGYVLTTQADAKACLQYILAAFFIDAVESDFLLKFIPRGAPAVFNVPGTAWPWDPTKPGNAAFPTVQASQSANYGTAPVVVQTGLTAGQNVTVAASGTVTKKVIFNPTAAINSAGGSFSGLPAHPQQFNLSPTGLHQGDFGVIWVNVRQPGASPLNPWQGGAAASITDSQNTWQLLGTFQGTGQDGNIECVLVYACPYTRAGNPVVTVFVDGGWGSGVTGSSMDIFVEMFAFTNFNAGTPVVIANSFAGMTSTPSIPISVGSNNLVFAMFAHDVNSGASLTPGTGYTRYNSGVGTAGFEYKGNTVAGTENPGFTSSPAANYWAETAIAVPSANILNKYGPANGPNVGPSDGTGNFYPSKYVASLSGGIGPLMGLIGAFTDSAGNVISTVFVGNGGTFTCPAGATQFQVGVNDVNYNPNINGGNFTVTVGKSTLTITIPEGDLGLVSDGAKLTEQSVDQQMLPRQIDILYVDPNIDFQQNKTHKHRHRRGLHTKQLQTVQLPMVLQPDQAAAIAERMLYLSYLEAKPFDINLWKAVYMQLDPTDLVNFVYEGNTYTVRITQSTIGVDFSVQLASVSEASTAYVSSSQKSTLALGVPPLIPVPTIPTTLFLLDLPYLQDADAVADRSQSGFYWLESATNSAWPGGLIEGSSDGSTYNSLGSTTSRVSYGVVTSGPLAAPPSLWTWDMQNTITVQMTVGTLSGSTDINVLNGANAIIVGGEIIQFVNCVQTSPGVFQLSRLLRGRRNTEYACGTHLANETVLDPSTGAQRYDEPLSLIGALRNYKGVTVGQDPATVTPQAFTLAANDLKPASPVHLNATIDGSHNITITWVRRTRYSGDWLNNTDAVPLNEDFEAYDIEIYDITGTTLKRTFSAISTPNVLYTSAQQVTDFGSNQVALYVKVYQLSKQVGRGYPGVSSNVFSGLPQTGGVPVNTAGTVKKFAATIGDGSTTSFTLNHGLGTTDVIVQVFETAGSFRAANPQIQVLDGNDVTIIFTTAPATNSYRVIIEA